MKKFNNKGLVRILLTFCAVSIIFTSACTPAQKQQVQIKQERHNALYNEQGNTIIPMTQLKGHKDQYFVSADQWVDGVQYNAKRNGKGISFGHTDTLFQFTADSKQGFIGERMVELTDPPVWERDELWFPESLIREWFQDEANFDIVENQLVLLRNSERLDPYLEGADEPDNRQDSLDFNEDQTLTAQADEVNADKLIDNARNYLGIKYEFGANPFSQSRRFDCSSFVQHIYADFGIKFPRVSRDQANMGETVDRKNLKKGDLLFFNVPGRFNTHDKIGHVGIYIGDGKMIHASPAPTDGVQITNIHKKYWKETFITAKRVL